MSLTLEQSSPAPHAHGPVATRYMTNPFQEDEAQAQAHPELKTDAQSGDSDLAKYLTWAHTFANPYDQDFLMELKALVGSLSTQLATPNMLGEESGVLSQLDILTELIETERARLTALAAEYETRQQEIATRYTEEQTANWLKTNLPAAYARATLTRFGATASNRSAEPTS